MVFEVLTIKYDGYEICPKLNIFREETKPGAGGNLLVSVGTISTSRQVEHAFVTRDTKDRYAGGALRNEEMGQTIQLSVGGQRKRNGRMHSMHRSRIVFKKLVLDRSQTEFKEMHVLAFQCP